MSHCARRRLVAASLAALLSGCGGNNVVTPTLPSTPGAAKLAPLPTPTADKPLNILCSFFPIHQFTRNIVGDRPNVRVQLLLDPKAGCPHDYDLKPSDRQRIAEANVFVMNGKGLEEFASELVRANTVMRLVDSSDGLTFDLTDDEHGHDRPADAHEHQSKAFNKAATQHQASDDDGLLDARSRQSKAFAKAATRHDDHDHDHDHDATGVKRSGTPAKHDHDHEAGHEGHHHDGGANPHFFSSPLQAALQVENIARQLAEVDPAGADTYHRNATAYKAKLMTIAESFKSAAASWKTRKIVTMHEVFDYLARDIGLEIVATIEAQPGQEPSAKQMTAVIELVQKCKAPVFTEPQYPADAARVIAKSAGVLVRELDPVASGPADAPLAYYETAMEKNLKVLTEALSK